MLHIDEGENPVSIQLFGSDEDSLARAAEFIQENTKTDIVDINMGCPVNKNREKRSWSYVAQRSRQDLLYYQQGSIGS